MRLLAPGFGLAAVVCFVVAYLNRELNVEGGRVAVLISGRIARPSTDSR